ncbi:MAG: adenosylcobinamide-GDP ribazoletransferase [Clostridium sp.]|uniref:adenosylcobinamide-GDP ribazoletransferase n=1 Tax=Clostridium sp. TaxID=1506 RepID=UPI0030437455
MIKGLEIVAITAIMLIGAIGKEKVIFNNFLLLFQFITRIPVNISLACERENFRKATLYFPVVGAILGLIEYGAFYVTSLWLPLPMAAIVTVLIGIMITGGLHMDGLGDTCDGFFSFRSRERIIEIMKDSRVGSFGVIAVIIDIAIKTLGIYYIGIKSMGYMIIVIPMISRLFTVFIALVGKSAKKEGTGNLYIGNTTGMYFTGALTLTILIGNLFFGIGAILTLLLGGLIVTVLFNAFSNSRIGGQSGDTLGANNELVELMLFILVSSSIF